MGTDIGTARVLITGDYSKLAADFGAAQTVAASGAALIGAATAAGLKTGTAAAQGLSVSLADLSKVIGEQNAVLSLAIQRNLAHAASIRQATAAAHDGVTEIQATSGALRVLEGSGGIRAAERFLTMIPGLGAALQVAFPVVGAIALFDAFSRLAGKSEALTKAEEELKAATDAADKSFAHMETTLDNLNVEHVRSVFGAAAGTGAEATVLSQRISRARTDLQDLKDSINEVAYAEAGAEKGGILSGNLLNYLPFVGNYGAVEKIKAIGQQIKDTQSQIQELEGEAGAKGENQRRQSAEQAGQLSAASVSLQEARLKHQSDLNKAYSDEQIAQAHAVAMAKVEALNTTQLRAVAAAEAELSLEKAKQAALTAALADEIPKRIALARAGGAAESQGKDKPEQQRIGIQTQASVENIQAGADSQTIAQAARVADAQTKLAEVVVTTNREMAKSWQELTEKSDLASLLNRNKLAADGFDELQKKQDEAARAAEGRAKLSESVGKGQGEIGVAQLKAGYEEQGLHTLQQEIAYRQELAQIQDKENTAELTALAVKLRAAEALSELEGRSEAVLAVEQQMAALSGKSQASGAANAGQVQTLQNQQNIGYQIGQDIKAAVNEIPAKLGSALASGLFGGKKNESEGKEIRSALQGIGSQLLGKVFQQLLQQVIVQTGIQAALNALFPVIQTTQTVAIVSAIGASTGTLVAAIAAAAGLDVLAEGTDFARGGITLVGEKGPEIVNMPRGAQVIPNHAVRTAFSLPQSNRGGGGYSAPSGVQASSGGGDTHLHLGSIEVHAHGVSNPQQLAEMAVNHIPGVLKAKSASFSPFSK